MIAALRPLTDLWAETYYAWALSEIDPLHPDVPALALAHNAAARRVAGSRAALRIKTLLRPLGRAAIRGARRLWAWC